MSTFSVVQTSETNQIDEHATGLTRARYQRISGVYDRRERLMEWRFRPWRKKLWGLVEGQRVLEVGVGTGKNMEFWPADQKITAIDLTPGMLEIALQRMDQLKREDDLRLGDVQCLDFAAGTFDTVVAAFLFCSVPNPILGLCEVARVVRPSGKMLLLEHVRIDKPVIGAIMDALNPLVVRLQGANINRRTIENVRAARLHIERVENLDGMGMFKLIVARPSA